MEHHKISDSVLYDDSNESVILLAIAVTLLEDWLETHSSEEFAKRFGVFGTNALAKYLR